MFKILLLLIFLRPFISSLGFPLTNFIYSLSLAAFIFIWIASKGVPWSKVKPLKYPLILFTVSLFFSILFSQNKITSLKEAYKYITGLCLFLAAAGLPDKNKKQLINCILSSAVLISLYAVYQYFFGFKHLWEYAIKEKLASPFILNCIRQKRVFFPFVTPNTLAGYLTMVIPLVLYFRHSKKTPEKSLSGSHHGIPFKKSDKIKIFHIFHYLWIPLFTALLFTKSIGGLISILSGTIIYFHLRNKTTSLYPGEETPEKKNPSFFFKNKKQLVFLSGLLIVTGLVILTRTSAQKQYLKPSFSTIMRLHYWQDALKIIRSYPLSGVGIGNFNLDNSRYAHNSYLQICAEMGIIGLISFLWLIGSIIKINLRNIKTSAGKKQTIALLTANLVFLVHNLGDFTFFLPEVSFIWWILLGINLLAY